MAKDTSYKDLRKFTRLDWRYPVEFTIVNFQENLPGIGWQGGFTQNVSAEGMCLESVSLPPTAIQYLKREKICLKLRLNIPPTDMPVKAVGEVMWFVKGEKNQYTLGLRFLTIADDDLKGILRYAHWKKNLRKILFYFSMFICFLGAYLIWK